MAQTRRRHSARKARRLTAVLAADIAGYSRLMGVDEEATLGTLNRYRAIAVGLIEGHGGRLVSTAGDSLLAAFPSVTDTIECSLALQRRVDRANARREPARRMEFRVAVHLGDVIEQKGDIFGDGVNIAARLQSLALPGGVCVSGAVAGALTGQVKVVLDDLGPQKLHNIDRPVHAYRLRPPPGRRTTAAVPAAQPTAARGVERASIAVLPFQNMSGDPAQEYFADGVVEDIITALSRFKWLYVIARNSSFVYKGRTVDLRQVSQELDVRYVLEGSVRREGSRMRITAQLIDGTSGAHLWADTIDGDLAEVFELQARIAVAVATAIEPTLRDAEIERARHKPTANLTAYDYYLRALPLRATMTAEANREALRLLREAVALDPQYAAALAGIGMGFTAQRDQGWAAPDAAHVAEGMAYARAAVDADPYDPIALSLAGHTLASLGHDIVGGLALAERAVRLNPNWAEGWARLAMVRVYAGDLDAAVRDAEQSLRLSPFGPDTFIPLGALGYARLFQRRFDDARAVAERAIATPQMQNAPTAFRILVAALAHLGRIDDARAAGERLRAVDPGLRISTWTQRTPFTQPAQISILTEGFRLAGMPA